MMRLCCKVQKIQRRAVMSGREGGKRGTGKKRQKYLGRWSVEQPSGGPGREGSGVLKNWVDPLRRGAGKS